MDFEFKWLFEIFFKEVADELWLPDKVVDTLANIDARVQAEHYASSRVEPLDLIWLI